MPVKFSTVIDIKRIQNKTAHLEKLTQHLYYPDTQWPILSSSFVRLSENYKIDLPYVLSHLQELKKAHRFQPIILNTKKKRRTYAGIGLTAAAESKDPLYEASSYFNKDGEFISTAKSETIIETTQASNNNQVIINNVAPHIASELFSMFKLPILKIRIMELAPWGVLAPHFDCPYYEEIRLHCVLESNDQVFWEVDGQSFQIPTDGHFYWFDTGKFHSVYNLGKTTRSVLSVHLNTKVAHHLWGGLAKNFEDWLTSNSV
jgi:hypothetical protein